MLSHRQLHGEANSRECAGRGVTPDGTLVDDFVVNHQDNRVYVRNMTFPATISPLAMAEMIADTVHDAFNLGSRAGWMITDHEAGIAALTVQGPADRMAAVPNQRHQTPGTQY